MEQMSTQNKRQESSRRTLLLLWILFIKTISISERPDHYSRSLKNWLILVAMPSSFLTFPTLIPGRQEGVGAAVADFRKLKLYRVQHCLLLYLQQNPKHLRHWSCTPARVETSIWQKQTLSSGRTPEPAIICVQPFPGMKQRRQELLCFCVQRPTVFTLITCIKAKADTELVIFGLMADDAEWINNEQGRGWTTFFISSKIPLKFLQCLNNRLQKEKDQLQLVRTHFNWH